MSCSAGCPLEPVPELATGDDISALRIVSSNLSSVQFLLNIAQILNGVKMPI